MSAIFWMKSWIRKRLYTHFCPCVEYCFDIGKSGNIFIYMLNYRPTHTVVTSLYMKNSTLEVICAPMTVWALYGFIFWLTVKSITFKYWKICGLDWYRWWPNSLLLINLKTRSSPRCFLFLHDISFQWTTKLKVNYFN